MKKLLALLLAAAMVLALAACGGNSAPAATQAPAAQAPAAEAPAEAPAEEPAAPAIDWPTKTIRIIVGYAAGGDTDLGARIVADALSAKLGVSVIVENLTGGTGVVGRTELLANDPDGYNLMFDQFGSQITQVLLGNTTYAIDQAGTPIAGVGVSALALCVAKDNPMGITNMEDFIAYAEANPGEMTYSTPGQFTFAHLVALATFADLGIDLVSVATDGTATAVTEVLGGHVSALCVPLSGVQQYLESGDLILMGLSGPSELAPADSPLLTDYGADEIYTWYALSGPNDMDPALAQAISDAVADVMADEAVISSLTDIKIETNFVPYKEFVDLVVDYRDILKGALVAGGAIAE